MKIWVPGMITNHQHNHYPRLRMMMKMTFMIHPHLHGPAAMYTGLCGLNNFLIIKATTHLLCCLPKDMLWLPSMAMIEASQWDIFVGRAVRSVHYN